MLIEKMAIEYFQLYKRHRVAYPMSLICLKNLLLLLKLLTLYNMSINVIPIRSADRERMTNLISLIKALPTNDIKKRMIRSINRSRITIPTPCDAGMIPLKGQLFAKSPLFEGRITFRG
jgi:hypothetical protein